MPDTQNVESVVSSPATRRTLPVAIEHYAHTQALFDGSLHLPGIQLQAEHLPINDIVSKVMHGDNWCVAEMSMGRYVEQLAKGTCNYIALPIFLHRAFRYSAFYVRADSTLSPTGLRRLKIGIPGRSVTAVIYARALLTRQLGVRDDEIEWVTGETDQPPHVSLGGKPTGLPATPYLTRMLLEGEIDVLISPHAPYVDPSRVRHLFPDYAQRDLAYWRETGVYPIMHMMVLHRDIERSHPGTARKLVDAFTEARDRCLAVLQDPSELFVPLPFLDRHIDWLHRTMGPEILPYGVEKNSITLNAFLDYCHEQGVSDRRLALNELFQYG